MAVITHKRAIAVVYILVLLVSSVHSNNWASQKDEDSYLDLCLGKAGWIVGGVALGAGAVVFGVPAAVGAIGFKAAGIAGGSVAAGMMSSLGTGSAIVATCQSIGVVGVSAAASTVGGVVGAIGGAIIGQNACDKPGSENCKK